MSGDVTDGCGSLLLLAGLLLALLYWKLVLTLLVVAGLGVGVISLAAALRVVRLRRIARVAERRFAGDVCRIDDRFGVLEAIATEDSGRQSCLLLHVAMIVPMQGEPTLVKDVHRLRPPRDLGRLASHLDVAAFLEGEGISMVNDLAVEAKATQAAITCLREAEWARRSLQTITQLIDTTLDTLTRARGNELLEPAIPQLSEALAAFRREEQKLNGHRRDATRMLVKLHDFLAVPEALRPILTYDLEGLFDPARRRDLETSFQEVVALNQIGRAHV